MIQRIQTIYLLASIILISVMFGLPITELRALEQEFYTFELRGVEDDQGNYEYRTLPLTILFGVINLLILISLFLYKRRILQMRICIYNILLLIGSYGLIYYYLQDIEKQFQITESSFTVSIVLPAVTIILLYLAFRGIRRDELLVKAMDRIR